MAFDVLGMLGSVLSGGATGVIGVVVQRYFDLQVEEQKTVQMDKQLVHDVEMKKQDLEMAKQEWAGKTQVAQVEGAAQVEVKAQEAFATSLSMEPKRYSEGAAYTHAQAWLLVVLDCIRGVVRPFLTVYLCALTTYIWLQVRTLLAAEDLSTEQALDVWMLVIQTVLYLMTTCVLWWFGTRNQQQPPKTR